MSSQINVLKHLSVGHQCLHLTKIEKAKMADKTNNVIILCLGNKDVREVSKDCDFGVEKYDQVFDL